MEVSSIGDLAALVATVGFILVLSKSRDASNFVKAFTHAFEETVAATYVSFDSPPQAAKPTSSAAPYSGKAPNPVAPPGPYEGTPDDPAEPPTTQGPGQTPTQPGFPQPTSYGPI